MFLISISILLTVNTTCRDKHKAASTLEQKRARGRPGRGMRSNVDV